jgi:hypothetical protein
MSLIKISIECARDVNYIFKTAHSTAEYDLTNSNNSFSLGDYDQAEVTSELIDQAIDYHVFSEEFLRLFAHKLSAKAWKLASRNSNISIAFVKAFDYKIDFDALFLNKTYDMKHDIVENLKTAYYTRIGAYRAEVNPVINNKEPKMEKGLKRKISNNCGSNFIDIYKATHHANLHLFSDPGGFLLPQVTYDSIDEEDLHWACEELDDLCEEFLLLYVDDLSARCWEALAERNKDEGIFSDEFIEKYNVQLEVELDESGEDDDEDNEDEEDELDESGEDDESEGVLISLSCAIDINAIITDGLNRRSCFEFGDSDCDDDKFTLTPVISNLITDKLIRGNSETQYYSEDFLRHFAPIFSKATWNEISEGQPLTKSFLRDYADKINWDLLLNKSTYKDSSTDYNELREQFLKEKKETKTMATTKGTNTMTASNVTTMIKSDGLKASYRMASRQMVKGVTKALLAALDTKYTPDQLKFLEDLLKTDLGYALVSGMIGMGLTYAPVEKIQSNPHLQVLAEEFRVSALDTVGTKVLDTITDNFLPVIMECVKLLPQDADTEATDDASALEDDKPSKPAKSKKA